MAGLEFKDLREVGSISTILGGQPIAFIAEPNIDRWGVFSRVVEGETIELEIGDGNLVNPTTGDRWDPATGSSLSGLAALDRIPTFSSNFNNFIDIFPDAQVLIEPEVIRPIPPPVKSYIVSME